MSDSNVLFIGWHWRPFVGWCELVSSKDYAEAWHQLRARHPEVNAKLAVLPEGQTPRPVEPTRPASGR